MRNAFRKDTTIETGISDYSPAYVLIIPLKHQGEIFGAVELSGFTEFLDFEVSYLKRHWRNHRIHHFICQSKYTHEETFIRTKTGRKTKVAGRRITQEE